MSACTLKHPSFALLVHPAFCRHFLAHHSSCPRPRVPHRQASLLILASDSTCGCRHRNPRTAHPRSHRAPALASRPLLRACAPGSTSRACTPCCVLVYSCRSRTFQRHAVYRILRPRFLASLSARPLAQDARAHFAVHRLHTFNSGRASARRSAVREGLRLYASLRLRLHNQLCGKESFIHRYPGQGWIFLSSRTREGVSACGLGRARSRMLPSAV